MTGRALLALAALATTADAGVWDRAAGGARDEAARDLYDAKLLEGDTATMNALVRTANPALTLLAIDRATAAYREAAALRPAEAEPYFRIGTLYYQMFFDCALVGMLVPPGIPVPTTCTPAMATPARTQLAIDAWDDFERRAPLDPRVAEILFRRALLATKSVTGAPDDRAHLERAARDYEALIARADGLIGSRDEQQLGNLAETYMMLGRLEDAIATYQRAVAVGAARVSTIYGLAVALDRDGEGSAAQRWIRSQGQVGFDTFRREFARRDVFYVPQGESDYYFALLHEAFGNDQAARASWQRYLASGAHPEFQPRAREHLAALARHKPRAAPPTELDELDGLIP